MEFKTQALNFESFSKIVADMILANRARVVVIDGSLGSGKTDLASKLEATLGASTQDVVSISTDMFLLDRDRRHYTSEPDLMLLRNWFQLENAEQFLSQLASASSMVQVDRKVYDRLTGTQSKSLTVKYHPGRTILLLEGLYSVELLDRVHVPHDISIYLTVEEGIACERLERRNIYIPSERLEWEYRKIYTPGMKSYREFLSELNVSFDFIVDTSDSAHLKIERGATLT